MGDCGVCLYLSDSCAGQIDDVTIVHLEKEQRCCECRRIVPAGTKIEEASWYEECDEDEDGNREQKEPIYTCLVCAEIADAFYCDGRMYNADLWEAMAEVMGELNTSCFDRLKTPEAKAELQRRWMEWKGLTE
jgi:hypothetical protein